MVRKEDFDSSETKHTLSSNSVGAQTQLLFGYVCVCVCEVVCIISCHYKCKVAENIDPPHGSCGPI